jgi:hypothetical protein
MLKVLPQSYACRFLPSRHNIPSAGNSFQCKPAFPGELTDFGPTLVAGFLLVDINPLKAELDHLDHRSVQSPVPSSDTGVEPDNSPCTVSCNEEVMLNFTPNLDRTELLAKDLL